LANQKYAVGNTGFLKRLQFPSLKEAELFPTSSAQSRIYGPVPFPPGFICQRFASF